MNDEHKYEAASWMLDFIIPVSVFVLVGPGELNSYVYFGPVIFHRFTALVLIIAYVTATLRMGALSVPWRELSSVSLVVLGVHLYDVLWGVSSYVARGSGFPWIPLLSLAFTAGLVAWLDMKLLFLKPTRWSGILIIIGVCAFAFMVYTGWFQQMTLYETVGGADPTNLLWAVGKLTTVLAPALFTELGEETRVIKVSLQ